MRKAVIYCATNKINGKRYVGQTIDFKRRKKDHLGEAFYGRSKSFFHRAVSKYGEENFEWNILETVRNVEEIGEREKYWIDKLNTYAFKKNPQGYNMTEGGEGVRGYKLPKEARAKLSRSLSNRKLSEIHKKRIGLRHKNKVVSESSKKLMSESHSRKKAVLKLSLKGEVLEEMSSSKAFTDKYEIDRTGVWQSCIGKINTYKGFIWIFKEDLNEEFVKERVNKVRSKDNILLIDVYKELIRESFENCSKVAEIYEVSHSTILNRVAKHLLFDERCILIKESEKDSLKSILEELWRGGVERLSLDGEVLGRYVLPSHGAKAIGGHSSAILKCCRGKTQSAYGYKWRFLKDGKFENEDENVG